MKWIQIHGGARSLANKHNSKNKNKNLDKYNAQTCLSK
jgi:hypothetical protein